MFVEIKVVCLNSIQNHIYSGWAISLREQLTIGPEFQSPDEGSVTTSGDNLMIQLKQLLVFLEVFLGVFLPGVWLVP